MTIDEKSAIPYFRNTVRAVLGGYLASRGFAEFAPSRPEEMVFDRSRCRLRFTYLPEEPPPRGLMVIISVKRGLLAAFRREGVALWYATPAGSMARDYLACAFDNAEQLRAVLLGFRDKILEPYGRPLWENPIEISRLARRQAGELKAEQRRRMFDQQLEDAGRLFATGDHAKASQLYARVPCDQLSAVDRKRMEIASKRSAAGQCDPQ